MRIDIVSVFSGLVVCVEIHFTSIFGGKFRLFEILHIFSDSDGESSRKLYYSLTCSAEFSKESLSSWECHGRGEKQR